MVALRGVAIVWLVLSRQTDAGHHKNVSSSSLSSSDDAGAPLKKPEDAAVSVVDAEEAEGRPPDNDVGGELLDDATTESPEGDVVPVITTTENATGSFRPPTPATLERLSSECVGPKRRVKFLKFHKVGGTVLALVLTRYAEALGLALCADERGDVVPKHCDAALGHKATEGVSRHFGFQVWLKDVLPDALSVVVVRDPAERLMSRFFYDLARHHETFSGWDQVEKWLDTVKREETSHYRDTLAAPGDSLDAALRGLAKLDVVGVTEALDATIALVVLALGCESDVEAFAYENARVVVGRPALNDAPATVRKRLDAKTKDDRALHDFARDRMRKDVLHAGDRFNDTLNRLRAVLPEPGADGSDCDPTMSYGCYYLLQDGEADDPEPSSSSSSRFLLLGETEEHTVIVR